MIVGIDFSINSTALAIKLQDDKFLLFSFVPNYNPKLKGFHLHKILDESKTITINSYNKDNLIKDAIVDQSIKLKNADELSNEIIDIFNYIGIIPTEIRIEGFSFGSKGNSFIDMITFNTFLKVKLIQKFGHIIRVISPKSIKKAYTGNGNASKCDMLRSFMEKSDSKLRKEIEKLNIVIEGDFNIQKPLDDLVDAIALTLIEVE
jgi:Holliday junction resolvasome RuvABC endonuclease subunit